jgi:hypothetical protein
MPWPLPLTLLPIYRDNGLEVDKHCENEHPISNESQDHMISATQSRTSAEFDVYPSG